MQQLARHILLLATMAACGTSLVSGQEIKIVSPSMYEDLEAPEYVRDNCCSPLRFQQIYPAEDFSSLPNGRGVLIGFAWRPDGQMATGPRTSEFGRTILDLSTTSVAPYQMHDTFDFNIESPATRVIDRDHFVIETENVRSANGPKEFDYVVTFDEPFLYDTTQGNLLMDWIALDGISGSHLADSFWAPSNPTIGNARAASPYDLQQGGDSLAGVTQFRFVPLADGDFNGDFELNARDLDLMAAEMQINSPDYRFDLNADNVVDFADRRIWVEELKQTYFGDANLDRSVDAGDLNSLALNWQSPTDTTWALGDFSGDGNTNAADLNLLALNWQRGQQAAISAISVPEPMSALLLALGLMIGLTRFRCRRS